MTIKHIPGVEYEWWIRLLRQKWLFELFASVPPLIIACIGAARLFQDAGQQTFAYWAVGAALWLFFGSVLKIAHAREMDKDANAKKDHDGLRAAMCVVHASASHACGLVPGDASAIRVTFHSVAPPLDNPQHIEQIVPYVGGDGGGVGRRFSVRSGITGRCIRTKQPYTMHRPDNDIESYRRELAADWGYTNADVVKLSTDKMSCMAIPVLDLSGRHALGVIYFDSDKSNLFESIDVQNAMFGACGGVAKYVSERYGK